MENLSTTTLDHQVLDILSIAQNRVGAFVTLRDAAPGVVTLYSRHASDLADGLIARLPMSQLTHKFKGDRIGDEFGI